MTDLAVDALTVRKMRRIKAARFTKRGIIAGHETSWSGSSSQRKGPGMKKFDGYLSQISSILIDAYSHGYEEGFEKAKARFGERERPAADVATVRHGRWIMTVYTTVSKRKRIVSNKKFACSECAYSNGRKQSNYCPNCGAKMDGGADIRASFGDAPEDVGYQLIKE